VYFVKFIFIISHNYSYKQLISDGQNFQFFQEQNKKREWTPSK